MKELSIEEKAKRYDEAIERARYWEENPTVLRSDDICKKLFHELKESEDKKIKSDIQYAVRCAYGDNSSKTESVLAWLEKQGEQKPTIEMKSAEESLGIDSETYNKIVDECIYGEQKPADKKGMNLDEEKMTPFQKKVFCIIDTAIEEEQGLKQVCDELFALASNEIKQKAIEENKGNNGGISPNSEWSEEDERILREMITIFGLENFEGYNIGKNNEDVLKFLNSLKDRYTWKPSDAQMKALKEACDEHWEPDGLDPLYTLYQDLKKLREE